MSRLIGLYSPAPQSGKTTVADFLTRYGYQRVSFAEPIKAMATTLLVNAGYSAVRASQLVYDDKAALLPELRTTPRHILQTLGTEWGRDCIHPDIWTTCWTSRVRQLMATGVGVIADDCRFLNEAAAIKALGGTMWRIERAGVINTHSHASEGGLNDYPEFDFRIFNNSSVRSLHLAVCQRLGLPYIEEPSAA